VRPLDCWQAERLSSRSDCECLELRSPASGIAHLSSYQGRDGRGSDLAPTSHRCRGCLSQATVGCRVNHFAAQGVAPREGALLVGGGEPAESGDIGDQNCREFEGFGLSGAAGEPEGWRVHGVVGLDMARPASALKAPADRRRPFWL
jgi:hypothetical protein